MRGDDAVAHRAVELASPGPEVAVHHVIQLTPELAPLLTDAELVLFLDAAEGAGAVTITEVEPQATPGGWPHVLEPPELVRIAREAFGFTGRAYLCALPAEVFDTGQWLSARAQAAAAGWVTQWPPSGDPLQ